MSNFTNTILAMFYMKLNCITILKAIWYHIHFVKIYLFQNFPWIWQQSKLVWKVGFIVHHVWNEIWIRNWSIFLMIMGQHLKNRVDSMLVPKQVNSLIFYCVLLFTNMKAQCVFRFTANRPTIIIFGVQIL